MNPFIEQKKEQAQARKADILHLIKKQALSVNDVVERFNVSVATARNDLNALKKSKAVGAYRSSEEGQRGIMLYAMPDQIPAGKRRKRKAVTPRKRRATTRGRRGRPVVRRRRRATTSAAGQNSGAMAMVSTLMDRLIQLEVKVESFIRSGKR